MRFAMCFLIMLIYGSSIAFATQPSTGEVSVADKSAVDEIIQKVNLSAKTSSEYTKEVTSAGIGNVLFTYGFPLLVLLIAAGLVALLSRAKSENGESKLQILLGTKIMASFSFLILVIVGMGVYALNSLETIGGHVEELAEELIPVTNMVANIEKFQLEQVIAIDRVRGSRGSRLPTEPCVRVRTRLLM